MQIKEALNVLNDGHTIWKATHAKRVCKALEISFSEELIEKYYSGNGFFIKPEAEGTEGVDSLALSEYVAEQFKVRKLAKLFIGSGSQAREYARLVREKLAKQGKV